jgi:hypothetical protein
MRQTAFALILGSFLAVGLPAADQQLVNMVMPDAKVVAGINVTSARNSPFGTFLLRQMSANNAQVEKFVAVSGFNPQTDLDEVLVATPETPAAPGTPNVHGLVLARGTFNVEKISALVKMDGKQQIEEYNGATLISDPKNATSSAMAFIGPNIAVAGDVASVKAALDRRSQANSLDPQLSTKVNSLSTSQDAWAVSIAPLSSLNSGPAADPALKGALNGDLFKKITQSSGGIKFGEQVQLSSEMVAMDEKNATALGDVVRFLVGMATMNAGSAKGAPPAIITLLQTLSVQTQGNVVSLTVSVPEDQVEGLINSMQPAKKPATKI